MSLEEKQHKKILYEFGNYTDKKDKLLKDLQILSLVELEKEKFSTMVEIELAQSNNGQAFFAKILAILGVYLGISSLLPDNELSRNLKSSVICVSTLIVICYTLSQYEYRTDLIKLLGLKLKIKCIDELISSQMYADYSTNSSQITELLETDSKCSACIEKKNLITMH